MSSHAQRPVMPPTGQALGCRVSLECAVMGMRFVAPAVTPVAGHGGGVIGGSLGQDDPEAVGVLDPHLDQGSQGFRCRLPRNRDSGRGQPGMLGGTSRTWIQIITEDLGGPAACPETSRPPGRGRTLARVRPAG